MYRFLYRFKFSFLWDKCPVAGCLASARLTLQKNAFLFPGGMPSCHSPQQGAGDFVPPYPCQHLVFSLFFILAFLHVYGYLVVVLISISSTVNDARHFFMYFFLMLFIEISVPFACFLVGLFGIVLRVSDTDTNPLLNMWLANISSHSVSCDFILFRGSSIQQHISPLI